MRTQLDRDTRARIQEEAGRGIRLENLAYELNDWLKERGVRLYFDDSLRLSDGKTYTELRDVRLSRIEGIE